MGAAADVIDLSGARSLEEFPEGVHQIVAVDVIAHLLAFVAKNPVRLPGDRAFHQVGQETVQFRAGMGRAGEATAAEAHGLHAEIIAIFLHQHIGGDF